MTPLEPKGFFQYLPRTQYDQVAGFYMTDYGWTEVIVGMSYPPWQHPSKFSFTNKNGRLLDEHQLVYITRGSGTFWSSATGTIQVKPAPYSYSSLASDTNTPPTLQPNGTSNGLASKAMSRNV